MRNTRPAGFTLIELMIVVAVIAVLAAIAIPSYIEQLRKGKRAEAIQAIGDVMLRQEKWRADHPAYATMNELTGSAANTTSYNGALKYYDVSISNNTATDFTITATRKGDLANDPKCGNFIYTQAKASSATPITVVKSMSSGDTTYCWRQ